MKIIFDEYDKETIKEVAKKFSVDWGQLEDLYVEYIRDCFYGELEYLAEANKEEIGE